MEIVQDNPTTQFASWMERRDFAPVAKTHEADQALGIIVTEAADAVLRGDKYFFMQVLSMFQRVIGQDAFGITSTLKQHDQEEKEAVTNADNRYTSEGRRIGKDMKYERKILESQKMRMAYFTEQAKDLFALNDDE